MEAIKQYKLYISTVVV